MILILPLHTPRTLQVQTITSVLTEEGRMREETENLGYLKMIEAIEVSDVMSVMVSDIIKLSMLKYQKRF